MLYKKHLVFLTKFYTILNGVFFICRVTFQINVHRAKKVVSKTAEAEVSTKAAIFRKVVASIKEETNLDSTKVAAASTSSAKTIHHNLPTK